MFVCFSSFLLFLLAEFIHILDAVRFARLTPEIIATLEGLKRRVVYEDGIEPTELYVFTRLCYNT